MSYLRFILIDHSDIDHSDIDYSSDVMCLKVCDYIKDYDLTDNISMNNYIALPLLF